MPPLILHNVPDEELYVGEDGVQRPYAMVFPGDSNSRARRTVPETGSFGKSTRRSRSRTGTPAAVRREDPTLAAADSVFTSFLSQRAAAQPESPQRKSTSLSASISQPNLSTALTPTDGNAGPSSRYVHKEPTEVLLRGFKSTHQYAALKKYEQIAGRICEDYPRDPPLEQRRYKADIRDPALLRTRPMTPEERAKAMKYAGGEHWIKITFESGEAAEAAVFASPQTILGHLVFAELYRGLPPLSDEAIPANAGERTPRGERFAGIGASSRNASSSTHNRRTSTPHPRSFTTPAMTQVGRGDSSFSPPGSNTSSHTLDSATLSTATASSATVTGTQRQEEDQSSVYCRKIPTARRIQLLPAEQALLPSKSWSQSILGWGPLKYISSDIIGFQLPKNELGEFDWEKASFYWKLVWYIDSCFGLFDIAGNDKDE